MKKIPFVFLVLLKEKENEEKRKRGDSCTKSNLKTDKLNLDLQKQFSYRYALFHVYVFNIYV